MLLYDPEEILLFYQRSKFSLSKAQCLEASLLFFIDFTSGEEKAIEKKVAEWLPLLLHIFPILEGFATMEE